MTTTTGSDDSAGASRFAREPLALVLAGGCGSRLAGLTAWQTKAAVPFGGRYRAIDFTLSNCVNSGLRRIALLTQYRTRNRSSATCTAAGASCTASSAST